MKLRSERVLFDFNYYKCCSCDIIQYSRRRCPASFDDRSANVFGIKGRLCLVALQYRMSHIMNWTIQQAKEITHRESKRKDSSMRQKHVFFFRYTIEILSLSHSLAHSLISRNWLKCSFIKIVKNPSKRSLWSIYFKAQADCSIRLFIC